MLTESQQKCVTLFTQILQKFDEHYQIDSVRPEEFDFSGIDKEDLETTLTFMLGSIDLDYKVKSEFEAVCVVFRGRSDADKMIENREWQKSAVETVIDELYGKTYKAALAHKLRPFAKQKDDITQFILDKLPDIRLVPSSTKLRKPRLVFRFVEE